MKKLEMTTLVVAAVIAFLILAPSVSYAQPGTPANSVVGFPGAGVLQAGDMWDSFLPQAFGPFYSEGGTFPTEGARQFIRFGNFDRIVDHAQCPLACGIPLDHLLVPLHACPGLPPGHQLQPDEARRGRSCDRELGAGDLQTGVSLGDNATNKYSVEPYWVDGASRQHAVYEAAWPTNIGMRREVPRARLHGPELGELQRLRDPGDRVQEHRAA